MCCFALDKSILLVKKHTHNQTKIQIAVAKKLFLEQTKIGNRFSDIGHHLLLLLARTNDLITHCR